MPKVLAVGHVIVAGLSMLYAALFTVFALGLAGQGGATGTFVFKAVLPRGVVVLTFAVLSVVVARRAFGQRSRVSAWSAVLGAGELAVGVVCAVDVVNAVAEGRRLRQPALSPGDVWGSTWPAAVTGGLLVLLGVWTLGAVLSRWGRAGVDAELPTPP